VSFKGVGLLSGFAFFSWGVFWVLFGFSFTGFFLGFLLVFSGVFWISVYFRIFDFWVLVFCFLLYG